MLKPWAERSWLLRSWKKPSTRTKLSVEKIRLGTVLGLDWLGVVDVDVDVDSCCLRLEEVGLVGSLMTVLFTKSGMFFLLTRWRVALDMIGGEAPCRCKVGTPGRSSAFPLYGFVAKGPTYRKLFL